MAVIDYSSFVMEICRSYGPFFHTNHFPWLSIGKSWSGFPWLHLNHLIFLSIVFVWGVCVLCSHFPLDLISSNGLNLTKFSTQVETGSRSPTCFASFCFSAVRYQLPFSTVDQRGSSKNTNSCKKIQNQNTPCILSLSTTRNIPDTIT